MSAFPDITEDSTSTLLYEDSIKSNQLSAAENQGQTLKEVTEYYGKVLTKSADLKTNACCTAGMPPERVRKTLSNVHDEVVSRYYGCGFVAPDALQGLRVLDLGCGAGQDCYILAQLVGESGSVVGVDMTDEQLTVARSWIEWHRDRFGYRTANTEFLKGYIEDLGALGLADESFDVIVSNCVINLSPDKESVFREAWRLLKPGGELYFSDVYSDRRIPAQLCADPVLWGECLSGALYWNDFLRLSRACGFRDPRLVSDAPISIQNAAVQRLVGHIEFTSATYRLWKLPALEPDCEDYGQAVVYLGSIDGDGEGGVFGAHREYMDLDNHHRFWTGKVSPVCGNTYRMLRETRFAPHFRFLGDFSRHFGIYPNCGKDAPFTSAGAGGGKGGGCC